MSLRNYSAKAAATEISAVPVGTTLQATDTTFSLASMSGFPASTPYTIAVGVDEEVMLVTAHNTVTGAVTVTRGYDSTTATTHAIGSVVKHAISAIDFREANSYINTPKTWGQLKNGG